VDVVNVAEVEAAGGGEGGVDGVAHHKGELG